MFFGKPGREGHIGFVVLVDMADNDFCQFGIGDEFVTVAFRYFLPDFAYCF